VSLPRDQHVGRLEVPMHEAALMGFLQRLGQLVGELDDLAQGQE
jgi:hypothetical protein